MRRREGQAGGLDPRLLRFDPLEWPDEDGGPVDVEAAHARWEETRRGWASRAPSLDALNALFGEGFHDPLVLDPRIVE